MELFVNQVLAGLAIGGVYAALALAIVAIYRTIGHVNFAQGEMAMFSTYIAWQLLAWGVPYWPAFALTIALSFAGGFAIERILFAPLRDSGILANIVGFIALYIALNSLAGFIWDFNIKPFPTPFGNTPLFGGTVGSHEAGMIASTLLMLVLLFGLFRYTRVGLAMRAAIADPASARLAGIGVARLTSLGWGLAAAIGAVAGMLIAPVVFLEPNMMLGVLLFAFAAAVLGGLDSPLGAVIGGFLVGVIENLIATFLPHGGELKSVLALLLIVLVLLFRPQGLLGRPVVERV